MMATEMATGTLTCECDSGHKPNIEITKHCSENSLRCLQQCKSEACGVKVELLGISYIS